MSTNVFRTELDSPREDGIHVPVTNASIPPTYPRSGFQRIQESLDEEEEGGRELRGTSSLAGTGATTDSDGIDDFAAITSPMSAPSRRNKRKMTEPRRRRTDFSIRSLCSNSDDDEDEEERGTRGEEKTEKRRKRRRVEDILAPPSSLLLSPHPPPGSAYTAASSLLSSFSLDASAVPSFDPRQGPRPGAPSTDDRCPAVAPFSFEDDGGGGGYAASRRPPRKNYKNMTKQRRIEANARERTRVHTISAAFESLRRAVPSYSYNQRLSKLAILRIASSYILALATLAELDYGGGGGGGRQRELAFGDCVDLCTQTIQAEGRAKRRH